MHRSKVFEQQRARFSFVLKGVDESDFIGGRVISFEANSRRVVSGETLLRGAHKEYVLRGFLKYADTGFACGFYSPILS